LYGRRQLFIGNLSACGKHPTTLVLGICAALDRQVCLWQEYFNAKVAKVATDAFGTLESLNELEVPYSAAFVM
jgi:hypothetical protein